jgi:predicted metalloprotease with PDZ domain
MTQALSAALLALACTLSSVQAQWDGYKAIVDFTNIVDDKARVTVNLPSMVMDTAVIVFPETIPGTYDELQYWRRISNFKAVDSNGLNMTYFRTSDGQFGIPDARKLSFIVFDVEDTFDESDTTRPFIFYPAGTSIAPNEHFVINAAGFFPYVEGLQKKRYGIMVKKPKHLLGSSSLDIVQLNDTLDSFQASDYDELVDNPVMYAQADTASFVVHGTRVTIACTNSKKRGIAQRIASNVQKVCESIGNFLPSMPVDKYTFLVYTWSPDDKAVNLKIPAFGALEHSRSSLYFMPEQGIEKSMIDVAAHEFLHILVPLNVHSEEIDAFNFRTPQMSKHLWLYEGVTEYFATLAQVRDSMITIDDFLKEMRGKISDVRTMDSGFSFTELSKKVLQPEYNDKYALVYSYGAINAWLLDIVINAETNGRKDLLGVIYDLMKTYGPSRPFKDDQLFGEIERLTTPAVGRFLRQHVEGTQPLPAKELLKKIGIEYVPERKIEAPTYGLRLAFEMRNGSPGLYLDPEGINVLEVEKGDKVVSINGKPLPQIDKKTIESVQGPSEDDELVLVVDRRGEQKTLEGKARRSMVSRFDYLELDPKAGSDEQRLMKAVLGKR